MAINRGSMVLFTYLSTLASEHW